MLNLPAFANAVSQLRTHQIEISDWGAGYIKGRIDTGEYRTVFTGITYDKGWRVYVDGKETEGKAFEDGLLYFEIEPGAHEIELRYTAQGKRAGFAISAVSTVVLIGSVAVRMVRRKRRAAG